MTQPEPISGPEPPGRPSEATVLLRRVEGGDPAAAAELLPLVYEQLRATAGSFFRSQRSDHTLQPTALVHDAYLKLVGSPGTAWEGRTHFCAVAAKAMRQILQDHARAKRAAKRDAGGRRVGMTGIQTPSGVETVDLLALDEALVRLEEVDDRGARIVELRFFGGLGNDQIADVIGVSRPTVERTWRRCRAWLKTQLEGDCGNGGNGTASGDES